MKIFLLSFSDQENHMLFVERYGGEETTPKRHDMVHMPHQILQ